MPNYHHPGGYVEEFPHRPGPIEGVSPSEAVLIGSAPAGPVDQSMRVHGWDQYQALYGGIQSGQDAMGIAASLYFLNGGRSARIIRLACDDGKLPDLDRYVAAFRLLEDGPILLLPGQHLSAGGDGNPVIDAAIAHCEATGCGMVLVDPPPGLRLGQGTTIQSLGLPPSAFAALYYPWVMVTHPVPDRDPGEPAALTVAPSALAAGIWVRTDETRGVWKSPSGQNATLRGARGLEFAVTADEQAALNLEGINCLRHFEGHGTLIWGARTLATRVNPDWQHISLRRTAIYLECSMRAWLPWAVFEANDARLWESLRAGIADFLLGLFRAGALQGHQPAESFFVQCGLGVTMTQADVDEGLVHIRVGFAPLHPGEFVTLHIRQRVGMS